MCDIDLGNVAEWIGASAAVATAFIAWLALTAWRGQMRGTSRHLAAAEILEAAQLMKFYFYDARNPLYVASEFPAGYHQLVNPNNNAQASAWAYIYKGRWALLEPQILRLATLRAKAGALLGDECAAALEELAKKARQLHGYFQEKVVQFRSGPNIVALWPDQKWVQLVNDSVQANPQQPTDKYSLEFEEKFEALKRLIQPHI